MIGSQLLLAKDVTLYFELAGCCEAKFGHNLLLSKSLGRLDQQLLTEAPIQFASDGSTRLLLTVVQIEH